MNIKDKTRKKSKRSLLIRRRRKKTTSFGVAFRQTMMFWNLRGKKSSEFFANDDDVHAVKQNDDETQ